MTTQSLNENSTRELRHTAKVRMDTRYNPYILLISIHGLIRGHDLELGCDADTGGQTKYVLDLAHSLAEHENVGHEKL